jgi:hypothetical protein
MKAYRHFASSPSIFPKALIKEQATFIEKKLSSHYTLSVSLKAFMSKLLWQQEFVCGSRDVWTEWNEDFVGFFLFLGFHAAWSSSDCTQWGCVCKKHSPDMWHSSAAVNWNLCDLDYVRIQRSHRFHIEKFNLKKLNEVEGKEQYYVEVSNRFAALKHLDAEVEINSAWEMIRENIKISAKESLGYCELKKHKPWFDQACPKDHDQRKQAKLQWLQDPRK